MPVTQDIDIFTVLAKAAMRLGAPQTISISDADWTKVPLDTVTVERGGFVCNTTDYTITVPSAGLYSIHQGVDATFPGTEIADIMSFVDGGQYSPYPLSFQGRNAKPVSLFWESTVNLAAGAVIDMRIKNGASGAFDLNVIRLYFAIIKEH
jgi:hypothetical protein